MKPRGAPAQPDEVINGTTLADTDHRRMGSSNTFEVQVQAQRQVPGQPDSQQAQEQSVAAHSNTSS